ncbi:hypothetical protein GTU99_12675 [Streptomyces sp. PRKS01-65]|nr:hypothetical protein [Streptomyces harenosi]NEY33035.1 hypothetical protein [Streptomyces harenosi]
MTNPMLLAEALESAQMLQSPETAAELERLRAQVAELEERPLAWTSLLDAKSLDNFLIALQAASEVDPQDGAIAQIHELISSYRASLPEGAEQARSRSLHDHIVARDAEIERLNARVAELEAAVAEAARDAVRARLERDVMRERVSEPYGCAYCGVGQRSHGRRYIGGAGMHAWERPSDEQVKDRMLARRTARVPVNVEALRVRVAELEAQLDQTQRKYTFDTAKLRHERDEARVRVAETDRPVDEDPIAYELTSKATAIELPPATTRCGCGHSGSDHHHPGSACWARLPRELGQPVRICPCKRFAPVSVEESAERLARFLAPSNTAVITPWFARNQAPRGETGGDQ